MCDQDEPRSRAKRCKDNEFQCTLPYIGQLQPDASQLRAEYRVYDKASRSPSTNPGPQAMFRPQCPYIGPI